MTSCLNYQKIQAKIFFFETISFYSKIVFFLIFQLIFETSPQFSLTREIYVKYFSKK